MNLLSRWAITFSAALLSATLLLTAASPARAFDGAAIVAAIAAAQAYLAGIMQNLLNANIVNLGGTIEVEASRQIAAARLIAQGEIASRTQLYMEQTRAEAVEKFRLSPRACFDASVGTAANVAAGETRELTTNLNRSLASRTINTPSTSAAVAEIFKDHAGKYCSADDARMGRCSAAPADLQNADVRADNILGRSALNQDQLDAAIKFCRNVVAPVPVQNIPVAWEKTAQGQAFVSGLLVQQARVSAAQNACVSAIAERMVIPGLGASAQLNVADVSPRQLMEATVNGRFASQSWYTMLAQEGSVENLLRELNKQQAFELWMAMRQFQQMERVESLLASDLSVTVEQDAERLRRARDAAARASGG